MNNTLLAQAHKKLNGDLGNSHEFDILDDDKYLYLYDDGDYVTYGHELTSTCFTYISTVEEFINYKGDNMKTVTDAVNEFKGEWQFKGDEGLYYRNLEDCNPYYYYGNDVPTHHEYVCSKSQFNAEVESMSTNYGRDSLKHLAIWQAELTEYKAVEHFKDLDYDKVNKEINGMEIDYTSEEFWKDAPEGATHRQMPSGLFYKKIMAEYLYFNLRGDLEISKNNNEWHERLLTTRPKPSLIFTQEMHDKGELAPIGSECVYFDDTDFECNFDWVNGDKLVCVFHSTDENGNPIGVYRHNDGVTVSLVNNLIRPITPPITLEDGCAYQFDCDEKERSGLYNKQKDLFILVDGTVPPKGCVNIQKLTVEVSND